MGTGPGLHLAASTLAQTLGGRLVARGLNHKRKFRSLTNNPEKTISEMLLSLLMESSNNWWPSPYLKLVKKKKPWPKHTPEPLPDFDRLLCKISGSYFFSH